MKELEYLKEFIHVDDICVDVGAHGGSWAFPLGRISQKGRVFAFEALPYYAEVLDLTRRIMGVKNVEVINMAVTDHDREVQLVWRDQEGRMLTGFTHILGDEEKASDTITVKGVALDSFFIGERNHIGFLKMDVEGAEMNVLQGARGILSKHRPIVYSEINDIFLRRFSHSIADVSDFFLQHEYRALRLDNNGFIETNLSASGGFDVLFVPQENYRDFQARGASR